RDVDALLELAITRDRRLQLETLLLALDDRPTTDRLMLIAEYVVLRHHRPARARNDDDFAPVLAAAWRADPASAADVDTVREIVRRWVEGSGGVTSSLVRKEAVSLLELFSLRATDVLTPDE